MRGEEREERRGKDRRKTRGQDSGVGTIGILESTEISTGSFEMTVK